MGDHKDVPAVRRPNRADTAREATQATGAVEMSDHQAAWSLLGREIRQLKKKIARLRITEKEREAIEFMLGHAASGADADPYPDSTDYALHYEVLRALLERTK